jgi:hypothetical protein
VSHLDDLWNEYDRALIAYSQDGSTMSDPEVVRGSGDWFDQARANLLAAGQKPVVSEDEAVVQLGTEIWPETGPLRNLRACRRDSQ